MEKNEDKEPMGRLTKMHADHRDHMWEGVPWKAWGSWFSWGSPVGLGLGWTLFIIPLGVFLYLLHLATLIG